MEFREILMSIDFVIFLIVGVIAGVAASQFMKWSRLTGSILIGVLGSVIAGFVFDWLDFLDVGDIADPAIAGVFGAVIFLAVVWVIQGTEKNTS